MTALPERVRESCAEVVRQARHVTIDDERLAVLAAQLAERNVAPPQLDPAHHHHSTPEATVAFVVTLDAINFGSGWFPHLRKRPGCSGYFTVATGLKEQFDRHGPWSSAQLDALTPADCAAVLGQDMTSEPVAELMTLFARALGDLGRFLERSCESSFVGLVESAEGSAAGLAERLVEMDFYRDVASYEGNRVSFYKRAQITCADLALAFGGEGPGAFRDLDSLTIFADNLVPHVLRCERVLAYRPELIARIEAAEPIEWGSPEEVEIRASAVTVVERMCAALAERGTPLCAGDLDHLLWNRGQSKEMKAVPRHRTRCVYY